MAQVPEIERLQQAIAEAVYLVANGTQFAVIEQYWARKRDASTNPLVKCSAKYFSQNDEDGILLEICRRMDLKGGVFVELGVGNGLENNSLILLMHGWRGVWLGGEALAFEVPENAPLLFQQSWITRENCQELVAHGLAALGESRVDMLSVDIDGNDLHVLEKLLQGGLAPDIVVVEYNGKFPPPVRWAIRYDAEHVWDLSDYQGASLQSFADVLEKFGYRLIACNLTGSNAFFVGKAHTARFADVPTDIGALFVNADFMSVPRGHRASPRTIVRFLEADPAAP